MFKLDKSKKMIAATFIVTALTLPTLGCASTKLETLKQVDRDTYTDNSHTYSYNRAYTYKTDIYEIKDIDSETTIILTDEQIEQMIESGKEEVNITIDDQTITLSVSSLEEYKNLIENNEKNLTTVINVSAVVAGTVTLIITVNWALAIKRFFGNKDENKSIFKEDEEESASLQISKSKRK